MSNETKEFNGNRLTASQLEHDATKIEENLEVVNKSCIIKMLKVLNSIINILKRRDDGIFKVLLKWFRLYLKLFNIIDPDDKKILKFYENTVPTIITYLIGCLQYKPKKVPNYHHDLLEILEELIESVQPNVLRKITKFEKETIGCLWTPIELAGDYNTQLKALKIFSVLLRQFDENRQKDELNAIKWANLNFFQEKLKAVVQATKLSHVLENLSRELLNNFNMSLSKTLLVYSFHCVAVTFAKQYKFYKPLNLQKFWIDINYCPKTLSFCGRCKLRSDSKYEIISVVLRIRKITLKNNTLQVYFNKPAEFSKYSEYFSSEAANVFEFTLPDEEKQRLIKNDYVIEYFNNLHKSNSTTNASSDSNTFDLLKTDMKITLEENKTKRSRKTNGSKLSKNIEHSQIDLTLKENTTNTSNLFDVLRDQSVKDSLEDGSKIVSNLKQSNTDESSKTFIKIENEMEPRPKRSVRVTNKFFKSFLMEESFDELKDEIPKRKRKLKRKPRQTKPRCKQVCKVTPTVDLTKIEDMESLTHNGTNSNKKKANTPLNNISKTNFSLFNTQRCGEVIKSVADVYEVADTTYAKPGQSYKNYQLHSNPIQKTTIAKDKITVKGCKKKIDLDNQPNVVKRRKLNCNSQENKENENPQSTAYIHRPASKTKTIISPHLFETQINSQISPINRPKKDNSTQNELSSSSECEQVRSSNKNILKDINHICTPDRITMASSSNATTPRPTSAMNVSNLSDSDIEITHIKNFQHRQHQQTNLSPDNMILDMESIELQNNSNIIMKPANINENIVNFKENCDVLQQQIVDDFEDNSDNEFDSNCLAPIQKAISDLMANHLPTIDYKRECVIFKNRPEEANSSDDEASILNDQVQCNETEPINNKIEKVLQKSVAFNTNLCQEKNLCTLPDNNFQISSNLTTRTATKCQVTPTALIMHKIQVSAEKSIILKRNKPKKGSGANRCLNNVFTNKNIESMQLRRKDYDLPTQYINAWEEINYAPPCSKSYAYNDISLYEIHDPDIFELIKSKQNDGISKYGELSLEQQSSSILPENCENKSLHREFDITPGVAAKGASNSSFRNDFFQILNNYNSNINDRVDSIIRQGIKNISDRYTQHFLGITKSVLKKTEENRMKLEEIRAGIGNLVRELEWKYDAFINKSKEFDIHSEMCKRILENLTKEIPNFITKEYEDIVKNLHNEPNVSYQNACHNFLEKYESKYD